METTTRDDRPEPLRRARVLIVGAGALGAAAALALAGAGVGTIVLLDPDVVELSNLQRQILHRTSTLGAPKVESAARLLARWHPGVRVETHRVALDPGNLGHFFAAADFVIDATDGIAAKFLINDGAVLSGRAFSHAGILGFAGQTMAVLPGQSACLRCLFPEPPPPDSVASCQEAGIIGAVAGVIGSLQAAQAIHYLRGAGGQVTGRLFTYDARTLQARTIAIARRQGCALCGDRPSITNLDAGASGPTGVCV